MAFNKTQLKKIKKDKLIEMILHFQNLTEDYEEELDWECPSCGKKLLDNGEDIYCSCGEFDRSYSGLIMNSLSNELS